jgi:hypothetical protein
MCKTRCTVWDMPDKPWTQDCKLLSQAKDFWEPPGRCQLCWGIAPFV